ncbi:MAG: peptide-methionine (S)-S-oxide reductase MsrA [Verrucomicrobiota bacterium]|nr:peptide-methionine (S)-S-oxide reductase MsrA [Verrucomicrobiota bacterium]
MKHVLLLCHLVAALSLTGVSANAEEKAAPILEKAVFAGGCFWCMQPPFDHAPGVVSTLVGYAGGREQNPTYRQVSSGETGHRESIEVTFDPAKITYDKLLDIFWHNIDPIQTDGQFHDFGDQYATAIFYTNEAQRTAAERSKEQLAQSGKFNKPIATVILPAGKFWPAEEYHQKYYLKSPIAYRMYRFTSGRNGYLQKTWGAAR